MKCDICGEDNGSCNFYVLKNNQKIIICPSCLFFSDASKARLARKAHKNGLLVVK